MYGIVLRARVRLIIGLAIQRDRFLHAQDGLHTQYGIQVRVLTTGLLTTTPARITEDVDVGTPERQLRIAGIVRHALWYVEQLRVIVVGTVPVGTCLVADLREYVIYQLGIERSSQTDGLGIDGIAALADTMTGLAPPVV